MSRPDDSPVLKIIRGKTVVVVAELLWFILLLINILGPAAVSVLIGHAVLAYLFHAPGYTSNNTAAAAAIGATGCAIGAFITVGLIEVSRPPGACLDGFKTLADFEPHGGLGFCKFWALHLVSFHVFFSSVFASAIGCAILLSRHVDLGGWDVSHSVAAGTLGGTLAVGPAYLSLVGLAWLRGACNVVRKWASGRSRPSGGSDHDSGERDEVVDLELAQSRR